MIIIMEKGRQLSWTSLNAFFFYCSSLKNPSIPLFLNTPTYFHLCESPYNFVVLPLFWWRVDTKMVLGEFHLQQNKENKYSYMLLED
uniref:Uncharacterized protein n=1 Tax=Nelumbo nucifera TaxID=4432 RepID=A0A822YEZ0_NELNU|nr:TPA_asm: hypothetical protein HUJ06_031054 [Nelumbo nucifera]